MENLELIPLSQEELNGTFGGDDFLYDLGYALSTGWNSLTDWVSSIELPDGSFSPDSPVHGTNPSHFM